MDILELLPLSLEDSLPSTTNRATHTGLSITTLPTDAIVGIFDQLRDHRDRLRFARTCRSINQCMHTYHWQSMTIDFRKSQTFPPHCFSNCSSVPRYIKVDQWHSSVNCRTREGPSPEYTCKFHSLKDCARCSACTLERTFCHVDEFLIKHEDMLSKRSFELAFTGSFGQANDLRYPNGLTIAEEYRLRKALNARGWSALDIKSFQFNMYWKFWDTMILSSIPQSRLLTLKIPFPHNTEVPALVRALSAMSQLQSLAVTDIPDINDLPRYAPMLGQGIRSRQTSLRELDLEMTNFNRPNPYVSEWERDETFPRRQPVGWFLEDLFLDPEDLAEWYDYMHPDYRTSECVECALSPECEQPLLQLEKLRLKNIDIPAHASHKMFDWTYLKELRLPHGRADDAIWEDIQIAQLEVLEDIDYTQAKHPLVRLIQSQSSLKSVTFARPQPVWQEGGVVDWEDGTAPRMTFQLAETPAPLGPATEWGRSALCYKRAHHPSCNRQWYPGTTALLVALGMNKGLENLHIPADMFDITPAAIKMASRQLKSLTHLNWGFDYEDQACRHALIHDFLPSLPHLRRLTFQSLSRSPCTNNLSQPLPDYDAETLIKHLKPLGASLSPSLRYVRFLPLIGKWRYYDRTGGRRGRTYVYYKRREACLGRWWVQFVDKEGEKFYAEDRTPCLWPGRGRVVGEEGE